MTKNNLLIVNPSALQRIYQSLSNEYAAIEPPIWAALLAKSLLTKGYSVELMDCEGSHIPVEDAAILIEASAPSLVAIIVYGQQPSASTQNMHGASLLATEIKKLNPKQKIIMVGGHVSALPKKTLDEESIDFVAHGEGLYTLEGLLHTDLTRIDQLAKIPGLWYRDEFGLVKGNPAAAVIPKEQLSTELPGMAFDLLPMKNYRAHNWHCFDDIEHRQPYASVYTSLGCPYSCSFCCINAPFGKSSFRYWDPEFIIKQFDILANDYGVKNVKIADEMFVLHDRHFMRLCELLKERNYGFNIWAYSRVDTVKPKHLQALKEAGVNWLVLGIESVSKRVRDGVIKGRFEEDTIPQIVKMIQDHDIRVHGNYIFGLPDDDFDSMKMNLDAAMEMNCEMANFYSAMAYPGSALYTMAGAEKWTLPDSWIGYSQHSYETLPLPTKHLSAGEVLSFRDKAWQAYYTNPKYHAMLSQKFGPAVSQHINDLTLHRLKRKHAVSNMKMEFEYPHFNSREFVISS